MEEAFRRGGLAPPDPATVIGADARRRQTFRRLVREGALICAKDHMRRWALVFHREAVGRAQAILAERFGGRSFLAAEASEALGIPLAYCWPLLAHLDATGFTWRQGERRVICAAAQGKLAAG
jgi:selenocysteine-specific elongation factor